MIEIINTIFETYYWLLIAALVLLVPLWFGRFVFEVVATLLTRRRDR